MSHIQNFHEKLEADLARLTAEVKAREKRHEARGGTSREIVRESLEALAAEVPASPELQRGEPPQPPPSPEPPPIGGPPAPGPPAGAESDILPAYLANDPSRPEVKLEIERLIEVVFEKGIGEAVRESKKHPPFVRDAFHDALVDKLLPELERRGIVK